MPVTWRFFVKHQIFRAVTSAPAGKAQGVADVYLAYGEVVARFADLPSVTADTAEAAAA